MRTHRRCGVCHDYCDEWDEKEQMFYCKACDAYTGRVALPVETQVWQKGADGYLHRVGSRKVGEVFDDLAAHLESVGLFPDEYLGLCDWWPHAEREAPWPWPWRWIACFAVPGGNEGHYIHIHVVRTGQGSHGWELLMMALGKTLREGPDGLAYACRVAAECTRAFYGREDGIAVHERWVQVMGPGVAK